MKAKTIALWSLDFFCFAVLASLCIPGYPSLSAPKPIQEDVTTVRVNVGLVLVEVVVLDNKGKPATGLKQGDFRIFEDGREQQISNFDAVSDAADKSTLPTSLADIDERTQRGKVVLLLFDQSTIGSANSRQALDAAEQYVRQHMHSIDLMGVAVYVQSVRITCPLTHDAAKVIEAIHRANEAFAGQAGRAVQGTSGAKELRSQVVDVFRGLKSLCTSLEPVRGRKTVFLFTEDMSWPVDVASEFNSLVAEARRSEVSFFSLDAGGQSGSSSTSLSSADPSIAGRPGAQQAQRYEVNPTQFQNQTNPYLFRSLAGQTDGYPVYNTNNLAGALERVDLELSHYYVLGFLSSDARSDGKPHKIEVKLNLEDAKLKYRGTYTDPHPTDPLAGTKSENSLRAALSSSAPATQLPVSFRPVYFYEIPQVAQIPVMVKIGRGSIALKKKAGQWIGSASIMGVALAEDGTTASRFSGELNISLGSAQVAAFQNQDLVYRNFLRLRPGRYHLKLVVLDEKGKAGTAEQDISIPAFNEGAMNSSSLIMSQETVSLPGLIKELKPQMLSQMDPMQFNGVQIYAPLKAEFDREQPLVVFYRIYSPPGAAAQRSFKAVVQAIDEKGERHPLTSVDLASSTQPVSQTETAIGFTLPCRDLKPGKYRLKVETIDSASGQSVTAETDFLLRGLAREPADQPAPQLNSGEATPPSTPAASLAGTEWAPGNIDRSANLVKSGIACSLPDVLSGAGKQIQELIKNVDRFTATEVLEHQEVNRRGILQAPETRRFDYMVSIHEARGGLMSVEEFRNGDFSPDQLPSGLATLGTPSVVLIFHPRYVSDFDMACDGLGEWEGQPAWLVRFEQRKDRPNNMHSYRVGGTRYDVRLRGRAWIKSDTYEVVRLETDLVEPIPSIQLRLEHMKIEYHPVQFPERKVELWLPKSAELYLDYRGHRFRRQHHFTDFKLFSVDTKDEITPPKIPAPKG